MKLNNAGNAALSLSVGGNNASTTFSGNLLGAGSLTKLGSGILTLTAGDAYSGSTTVDGGTLQMPSGIQYPGLYVGYSAVGAFAQSGGTNLTSTFYLGYNSESNGTYILSGSGLLSTPDQYIGWSGSGSFVQPGGSNSASSLYLGYNPTGSGTYLLSGPVVLGLSASNEYIGYDGSGSFCAIRRKQFGIQLVRWIQRQRQRHV